MDHRRLQFPEPRAKPPRTMPAAFTTPLRLVLLVGLLITTLGALLPWIHAWRPGTGFFDVSGFERAGDAGLILELAAIAAVLTWSDRAWDSRITIVVAGPLLAGVVSVLVMRLVWADAIDFLKTLEPAGGYGWLLPAFYVTVAGTVVTAVAGGAHLWGARQRLSFNPGLTSSAVAGTVGAVSGAIVGFIGGTKIAELFTRGAIAGVTTSVLIILAFTLAFVGAWAGAVGGASLARNARRR